MKILTKRQHAALQFIWRSIDKRGYPPTSQELADEFEVSKTAGQQYLAALEAKGCIQRTSQRKSRAIKLTKMGFDIATGAIPNIPTRRPHADDR